MKYDLPQTATYITKYNRYQVLYLTASKTPAEIVEFNGLQTDLTDFMMSGAEYNAIIANIATNTVDILTKAPISHASATSIYGYGTTTLKGHVAATPVNGLSINSGVIAQALATETTAGTVIINETNGLKIDGTGTVSVDAGSTSQVGTVQLSDVIANDSTKALTPKGVYNLTNNYARVHLNSDFAAGAEAKVIGFVVDYDPNGYWDAGNSRFVIPSTGVSKVEFLSRCEWGTHETLVTQTTIRKNNSGSYNGAGRDADYSNNASYSLTTNPQTAILDVVNGDYFELFAFQGNNDGDTVNVLGEAIGFRTWFEMRVIQ